MTLHTDTENTEENEYTFADATADYNSWIGNFGVLLDNFSYIPKQIDSFKFISAKSIIFGTDGNDIFIGSAGGDNIYAGAGDDIIIDASNDPNTYTVNHIYTGSGDDLVISNASRNVIEVGAGNNRVILTGDGDNNEIILNYDATGNNYLDAGTGDWGTLYLNGYSYTNLATEFSYNFDNGSFNTIKNFESVIDYSDGIIIGNSKDNYLSGGSIMNGAGGDDTLRGNYGFNNNGSNESFLTGGAGNDIFSFNYESSTYYSRNVITDFTQGEDVIKITKSISPGFDEYEASFADISIEFNDGNTGVVINGDVLHGIKLLGEINLTAADFVFDNTDYNVL